jgi:DNA-binding MarR family transcriptional regulator
MTETDSSSPFTNPAVEAGPFGPPLTGALLRMPWEAVQERMLERLHEQGLADFDASYLTVFQYPGPQGQRPSELATRLRISKQALNHLLGQLERRGYLGRDADPDDGRSKRITLTSRGAEAISIIRDAVAEMEESWARQLGPNASTNAFSSATSTRPAARLRRGPPQPDPEPDSASTESPVGEPDDLERVSCDPGQRLVSRSTAANGCETVG